MLKTMTATATGLALAATLGATAAQAEMPEQLNFGIISTESSSALEASFGPFLEAMEKTLGVTVKPRSEEHTSELQSLMRTSNAVFCLKKQKTRYNMRPDY